MTKVKKKLPWWVKLMRYFARTIVILWIVLFAVYALFQIGGGAPWYVIPIAIAFTTVTLAGIVFLWIWEAVGSFVLMAGGLFILVLDTYLSGWPPSVSDIPRLLFLSAPLIVAGVLSFLSWWFARKALLKEE